jgi:ribonuclease/clavin/mitogillin
LIKKIDVVDSVAQIKMSNTSGGVPIMWVSAYLVDDLLIDTGCNYTKRELFDLLKPRSLRAIVNTHHHEDHVSCNYLLQSARKIRIYAHHLAVPLLRLKPKLYSYQELTWGYPDPSEALPIGDTIESENHEFRVIRVPGHSIDHIAIVEPKEGWVFIGDAFISARPVAARLDEDQWRLIASLKKVREFSPRILFTAVPDPVVDATSVLDKAISIREEIGNRIVKLSEDGLDSTQILKEAFGKEAQFDRIGMKATYKDFTQGQYSTENLVESYIHGQRYFSMSFPQANIPTENT